MWDTTREPQQGVEEEVHCLHVASIPSRGGFVPRDVFLLLRLLGEGGGIRSYRRCGYLEISREKGFDQLEGVEMGKRSTIVRLV
jgi:hypothetical protein